jgi:hypothetical protein
MIWFALETLVNRSPHGRDVSPIAAEHFDPATEQSAEPIGRQDLLGPTRREHRPLLEQDHLVHRAGKLIQMMRDNDYGRVTPSVQEPLERRDAGRSGAQVQAGGGLVEQQQARLGHHRAGQERLHLLAGGQLREDAIRHLAKPKPVDLGIDPAPLRGPDRTAEWQSDRTEQTGGADLADGHLGVKRRTAGGLNYSDPLSNAGQVHLAEDVPTDIDEPPAGPGIAAQDGDECGFAGTVRSQNSTASPRRHVQRDANDTDVLKVNSIGIHTAGHDNRAASRKHAPIRIVVRSAARR